jgi:hypothetical protein
MILFRWMGIFAGYPWLILIPVVLFAVIALLARARFAFVVMLLWIIYGMYEWMMYARILCSGDCNIRMDLLFIYPVLLLLSLTTLIVYGPRIFLKR